MTNHQTRPDLHKEVMRAFAFLLYLHRTTNQCWQRTLVIVCWGFLVLFCFCFCFVLLLLLLLGDFFSCLITQFSSWMENSVVMLGVEIVSVVVPWSSFWCLLFLPWDLKQAVRSETVCEQVGYLLAHEDLCVFCMLSEPVFPCLEVRASVIFSSSKAALALL